MKSSLAVQKTDTSVIPTDFFQVKIHEMVIEIKMNMIPIISFSIYDIGVSHIIVNIFKFIFTLINLVAIISDINMWLWLWLKFMYHQRWSLNQWLGNCLFIYFSCDQTALRTPLSVRPSVCLSVCLSVCHTFFTMFLSSYHHEIFTSYYHCQRWCPCKRSRSGVKGQGHRGQNPI